MNIFILDEDPVKAAKFQCDDHVIKMTLESAQMLCTAHRVLDGSEQLVLSSNGRRIKKFVFNDDRDFVFYQAAHISHPCSVWTRVSKENYKWLFQHFSALAAEYTFRFNKIHKSWKELSALLKFYPLNIPQHLLTPYAKALTLRKPISSNSIVDIYRQFYQEKMQRMRFRYTKRLVPNWLLNLTLNPK